MADYRPKSWQPTRMEDYRPASWTPMPEAPRERGIADVASDALAGFAVGGLPGAAVGALAPNVTPAEYRASALGVSQGGTYGFPDELGGAIGAILPSPDADSMVPSFLEGGVSGGGVRLGPGALPAMGDTPEQAAAKRNLVAGVANAPSDYELVRDRMRAEAKQAGEESPLAYAGGKLGGAVGASVVTRKIPGVGGLGGAAQGVLEGGVAGLGESDADSLAGLARDTAAGAVVGGVLGKAGDVVGQGLSRGAGTAREWLGDVASERALKASGALQSKLPKQPGAKARALEMGHLMLDEPGLIRVGSTGSAIGERAVEAMGEYGEAIGDILRQADSKGVQFDPEPFLKHVEKTVLDEADLDPALATQAATISGLIDGYRRTAAILQSRGLPWTFARANEMKGNLQKAIFNQQGDVVKNQQLAAEMQGKFVDEIDSQLTPLLGKDAGLLFEDARKRYGAMKTAAGLGSYEANRALGNNMLGLPEQLAANTAAALGGGPIVTAAAGAASKGIRRRADSAVAIGAKGLSESDMLRQLAETNPEALGEFLGPISAAIGRSVEGDDKALAVTIHVLNQTNEKFREMMAQQNESRR